MRIVIDLQAAQGASMQRGIGRYSLHLAQAIARNKQDNDVIIALNGHFTESVKTIRAAFKDLLPAQNIYVWNPITGIDNLSDKGASLRKIAELCREAFLADLNPDVLLVSSLFEGLSDEITTSIGLLSNIIPTATICYDLIPYMYPDTYLNAPIVRAWYERKLDHMRRADLILTISESSRQDLLENIDIFETIVTNISSAVDSCFQPISINKTDEAKIRAQYKLPLPFVMYTGGIDYRKNVEGLIRAYAELPLAVRQQHHLAIVCNIQAAEKRNLEQLASKHGLAKSELVLTGYVSDADLLVLYNLCKFFVFPSIHEGFGLPVLEAMACGRAVIGSNTSSIPEVIARQDALFDPRDDNAITEKLLKAMNDTGYREVLQEHGLQQTKNFSWEATAKLAIQALGKLHHSSQQKRDLFVAPPRRPKLAFVSPLPPERSGISDYSAELLPLLTRYYDVDVIVDQKTITTPWINANCQIHNVRWFKQHANKYERVVYQFGNSAFHEHMFELLDAIPGIVILHDFFLSGIIAHMELHNQQTNYFAKELYYAHGYAALEALFKTDDIADVIMRYPCNARVLQYAQGVIVHTEYSRQLAQRWYGEKYAHDWQAIPLLRAMSAKQNAYTARKALDLQTDNFIVCSFGMLAETKSNDRLLTAWLASELSHQEHCQLIFVGENPDGRYGQALRKKIHDSHAAKRIIITGWTDATTYKNYLLAADCAVQLRRLSRGETSAAVLDCMNYGLPTIANAHGSMAELPAETIYKLEDNFTDTDLVTALNTLWRDNGLRAQFAEHSFEHIRRYHAPHICAQQYYESIENFYRQATTSTSVLLQQVSEHCDKNLSEESLCAVAKSIHQSIPLKFTQQQIFIDISVLVSANSENINRQSSVLKILQEQLDKSQAGVRIEPVYALAKHRYFYARSFMLRYLECPKDIMNDEPIDFKVGDVFLGFDFQSEISAEQQKFYEQLRCYGVDVQLLNA